uniref:Inactive poly [ADP-ribose] polymerase SRO2 n=1 Tax=Kalanchoe fedtschenkoi TaxID=63787 RepID=A0A7N0T5P3_KALFE
MAAVRDQQVSISIDDDEIRANVEQDDEVTSKPKGASVFGNAGFRVEPEGPEFNIVGRSFLSGLGAARTRAKVVDVYRCGESESVRTRARADAFRIYAEAVARKRGGDANVKQGWYGGSREEIGAIVAHGFSGCNATAPCNGGAWGRGVHLSAAKHAFDAVMGCEEDEAGMRHILMCRVILGNQEEIRPGSNQCYPSSMEFDSGVDCLTDPRKYLVWSAYMNVYILPSYIVSFKIDDPLGQGLSGVKGNVAGRMRPTSAWVKFPKLVTLLGRVLSPAQMAQITKSYKDFCEKKIGRQQMILKLRLIAGDKLLAATIKQFRNRD